MAGHSKFKNIMHRKGAQDKKRSQMFAKLAREITIAAKTGQADPAMNPRLRLAIQNARAENMPKDNIQRAIDKAAQAGGADFEEIRYEGFGPGGVGIIVEALTDNRNRTAGDIRVAFSKNGGNVGTSNSVASGFDRVGEVRYPIHAASEDAMLEAVLDAGADEHEVDGEEHVVICAFTDLAAVSEALIARLGEPLSAKANWRPHASVNVEGDIAASILKLVDALDDLDDVQNVYANFDISDAELAKLG